MDDSSILAINVVQEDQLDVAKDFTIRSTRNICDITDDIFTTNQLKDHIKKAIMDQIEILVQSLYSYAKPYKQRIGMLRMSLSYQPLKFQQLDSKKNPRQHVAHFMETCNNTRTDGNLMVKQFVHFLKMKCLTSTLTWSLS